MKALVGYDSKYGNTEKLARVIAGELQVHGMTVEAPAISEVGPDALTGIDLLVIGGPTQAHGMSPGMRAFFKGLGPKSLQSVRAAAFDTRYRKAQLLTGSAAHKIAGQMGKHGAKVVLPPESFFVAHAEGPLEDGELERARRWAATISQAEAVEREPVAGRS